MSRRARTTRMTRVRAVALPDTPLISGALPRVDWSDAYVVPIPDAARGADAQVWADAIFHEAPPWVRVLFVVREALVKVVGIERGGAHVFDTVSRTKSEVLLGADQEHLGFRASVLTETDRVVLSTLVQLRNRRGRAYFAVVRLIHPWVVRDMLSRAVEKLGAPDKTR